jgi:hypothetical protein
MASSRQLTHYVLSLAKGSPLLNRTKVQRLRAVSWLHSKLVSEIASVFPIQLRWCKLWTTTESKLLSWFTVVLSTRAGACLTLAFLQFIMVGSSRLRKPDVCTVAVATIAQQVQDQVYKELFDLTKSPFSVRGGSIRENKGKGLTWENYYSSRLG